MKDNDLTRNTLLDDVNTGKVFKTAMSAHDEYLKYSKHLLYAKIWITVTVLGIFIWGGFVVVGWAKDVAKDMAVAEVRSVASEKTAELKAKVKEKTEGKTAKDFGAGLSGLIKDVNNAINSGFDGALINNGFHPDAPNFCVLENNLEDSVCINYTETELDNTEYKWIETMWKVVCPVSYDGAMEKLKTNGQITYNDKRLLGVQCQAAIATDEVNERATFKQKLLDGLK